MELVVSDTRAQTVEPASARAAIARALELGAAVRDAIEGLQAWRCVEESTGRELGAMFDAELTVQPWSTPPDAATGATIRLAGPDERVTLYIVAAPESLEILGALLLGATLSPAEREDLAKEMLNTAAGVLERNFLAVGVDFAIGLPEALATVPSTMPDGAAVRRAVLEGAGATLYLVAVLGPTTA